MFPLNFKVTTSTCDSEGKLKLYSALQMMQDCSELWLRSEPKVFKYFEDNGMAQVLVSRQVEVIRRPLYTEDLQVQTSIYEYKPMFGFRNTFILDAEGKPCYRSWSMGAFINRATGKLEPVADEVTHSALIEPKREMNYGPRRIALPEVEPTIGSPIPVIRDYIDYNKHVNNAQYIRLANELLPEDFEVKGMRVEFKIPAHSDNVLIPHIYSTPDLIVVVLYADDKISTIIEFTR